MQEELFYQLRMPVWPLTRLNVFFKSKNKHEFYEDKFFQKAVFWASPEIYSEYKKIQDPANPTKHEQKILDALQRYYIRMCSRCTPYGFFAGWSLGKITESTALHSDEAKLEYTSRLDMNFMAELAITLERQPEIKPYLRYYPNTSIYKIGNRLRYVETIVEERYRKYNLSSVSYSKYLDSLLECASSGSTIFVLASKLVSDDICEEVAIDFVNQLIDNQILVSELSASVTGCEFSERLIRIIQVIPAAIPVLNALQCISILLSQETFEIEDYYNVWQLAQTIVSSTEIKDLIQTDLKINLPQNTISRRTIELISGLVTKIWPVFDSEPSPELESFKRKFEEKYGDAEVPLLALLDPEFGIPYGPYGKKEMGNFPLIQGVRKKRRRVYKPQQSTI